MKYALNGNTTTELPELSEPVDWDELTQIAMKHNLFAIFHEVACQYPEYQRNPEYWTRTKAVMGSVARQIRRTVSFLKLYQEFLDEGIQPIVMKGIVCRQLYGKYAEHRPSGDEDILVKKDDFYQVKDFLVKRGYFCQDKEITEAQLNQAEHVSFQKKNETTIEVHINLMGRRDDLRIQMGEQFSRVFEKSQQLDIQGVSLTVMSHTEHFLYIVMHAFKHFIGSGVGLRQILDIMMYQEHYEKEIDWNDVTKALQDCKVDSYLGDIQYIGEMYLGFHFEHHYPTACPETLLEDMIEVGAFGKSDRADSIATNIISSTIDQNTRGIGTLLRAGFPTRKQMAEWTPYLNEKPWMLPVEWVKRWIRFFRRTKKYDGNLMKESFKRSQKRMELLRKYGL